MKRILTSFIEIAKPDLYSGLEERGFKSGIDPPKMTIDGFPVHHFAIHKITVKIYLSFLLPMKFFFYKFPDRERMAAFKSGKK